MSFHHHRAQSAPMQTVARQSGPVTLAIRAMRANEAPTWEQRELQIDAECRAPRKMCQRSEDWIEADIADLDALAIGLCTRGAA